MRAFGFPRLALLFAIIASLTGCTASSPNSPVVSSAVQLAGKVHGGLQPVSGATIQLYAVGTSGDGSTSTPLLTQTVTSGSDGSFSITSLYSCNSATLVYLTAVGGNPGISSQNPDLALMTALGPCSSLTSATFISVNEVTTVAAVSALAPFMKSITAIGSSSSDVSALVSAFALANQFANPTTGMSPGNNVASGTTIPSALINTLANILSTCINSRGGGTTNPSLCGELFLFTTPGNSTPPTNTIASLLYLANNPTLNTALLYALAPASAPFQPSLNSAPSDFRILSIPSSPASLQMSPSLLTFPIGTVGVASAPQPVTIQNISASTVSLTALTVVGANAADFSTSNNCTATLVPSASCIAQVTITPSAAGPRIGYLSIASSSPVSPQYVTLTTNNAVPSITSVNPPYVASGTLVPLTIVLIGQNFMPASIVQVNGSSRLTGYFSSNEVIFQLTTADLASVGGLSVTVTNPPPNGGTSAPATFTVTAAPSTPVISSVSPTQLTTGSASTQIEVYGSNLVPGSIVQWNGTNLPTGFGYNNVSGYYMLATVPSNLLTTSGTAFITVDDASATPPVSSAFSLPIVNPPPPTMTSLSTNLIPTNTATSLTMYGTGFTPSTTVMLNGVTVPSTYNYPTQMTVSLPASAVLAPGVDLLTVSNLYGTSAPQYLTAYVPILNNSMIYNPVNGLFYLSIPSSAGAPYGNSVVSVDPLTGTLGTPIPVGSEPDRLAITSDGRYLWVALDGASAVRKVNLVAGTAGIQFSIGNSDTVAALAALPGATDSVVVSTYYGGYTEPTGVSLAIYDSGVARSSVISPATYATFPWALIVNGTTNEIYGPGNSPFGSYNTYSYSAAGVTIQSSTPSSLTYAGSNTDEVQIAGGNMYTDYGQVINPETGALVGTFYIPNPVSSGSTLAAQGSTTVDMSVRERPLSWRPHSAIYQIGAFNLADYSATAAPPIPISIPTYTASYQFSRLFGIPSHPMGSRWTRL